MRYTFNGLDTFLKIETAATHALDFFKHPGDLMRLEEGGKVVPADRWEIEELQAHMRDQAAPL